MKQNGIFCISLDFEKYWGIRDITESHYVLDRLKAVEAVVDEILYAFELHDIHASWAFVGLLFHENYFQLIESNRHLSVAYENSNYSPFPITKEKYSPEHFVILNAYKELLKIRTVKFQELASHTYSHFYALERGQKNSDFLADLDAMTAVGKKLDINFKSIVFPRNQVNRDYLIDLAKKGYTGFRGNQMNKDWANLPFGNETFLNKIRRVTDAYLAITKTKAYNLNQLENVNGLINIPASRFFRPPTKFRSLEKLKLKRIKREMSDAAQHGKIYHLWWHPHNFTTRPKIAMEQLNEILQHYTFLKNAYSFESLTMEEIAAREKN